MKKTEMLQSKSPAELERDLLACEEELKTLRFDRAFNKLKNVKAISTARRTRARILTLLRAKQLV
ncbi:MAG: 50S ribosomal protein L29 [Candidatus Azambacteria bacterium]|nr:50S ribosomal protein L29 [Candidatus Azambacteria bacterium]